jgi:hypothetical protein
LILDGDLSSAAGIQHSGGLLSTGPPLVFENGSVLDLGLSHLLVLDQNGVIFKNGSTFKINRTDWATGYFQALVSPVVIENGAKLSVADGASTIVRETNSVILYVKAGGLYDDTVFYNPLWDLKIVRNDLMDMVVIDHYKGSANVLNDNGSGISASTRNIVNFSILMDVLLFGDQSPDIQRRLTANLEQYDGFLGYSDAETNRQIIKELIGEEALTSFNGNFETLAQIGQGFRNYLADLHKSYYAPPAAGEGGSANHVWASGFGNWSRQKNDADVYGYDLNIGGLLLGYDREIDAVPGLTLGVNGAWASGQLKNKSGQAKTDIDTVSFGLYSSYSFGGGFF